MPDFWLPTQGCWIEIKGEEPTPAEKEKAALLHDASGSPVFIFYGTIPYPSPADIINPGSSICFLEHAVDCDYWWCECPYCGFMDIQYMGRTGRIQCCAANSENNRFDNKNYNFDSVRLLDAYQEARIARFEHGERR